MTKHILKLYDAQGILKAVQISPELWQLLQPTVAALSTTREPQQPKPHDLAGFAEFEAAWNFPYAYVPEVKCPCGAQTPDWRKDEAFLLRSANLGGLLVFHCNACRGTVRQKYFKDHVAYEFSPGEPCDSGAAK